VTYSTGDQTSPFEDDSHLQVDTFKPFDFNTLLKHGIEAHAEKVSAITLKASKEAGGSLLSSICYLC
jgi:hypothetical protein